MNIIRWISCHLIILIVVLSLAVAWYFRQDLASDFASLTNKDTANTQTAAVLAAPSHPKSSEQYSRAAPSSDNVSSEVAQQQPVSGWSSQPAAAEIPAQKRIAEVPGDPASTIVDSSAPAYPDDSVLMQAPVVTAPPSNRHESGSMFPPDDYDPEAGKSKKHVFSSDMQEAGQGQPLLRSEPAPAASVFHQQSAGHDMAAFDASAPASGQQRNAGQQSTGDFQEQLESARRYLWGGELDKARQTYMILQTDHPDNPEIASELGNLLMQQNRVQEASQA
jgi:hypothetical protein